MFSLHRAVCSLFTLQPHTSGLQVSTSTQTIPIEVTTAACSVHVTLGARPVPEAAAVGVHCTVYDTHQVVVAVIRAEHHAVQGSECIVAGITRVPRLLQYVVVCLGQHSERTILGPVPVAGAT